MAKAKIPKRVGGVKIPKKFRKKAKKALKLAGSPAGRDLAAAALAAAAAKARAQGLDDSARARAEPPEAEEVRPKTRIEFEMDGGEFVEALRTAALDGLRRFLEGFEEGLRDAAPPRPPKPPRPPEPPEPPSAPAAS